MQLPIFSNTTEQDNSQKPVSTGSGEIQIFPSGHEMIKKLIHVMKGMAWVDGQGKTITKDSLIKAQVARNLFPTLLHPESADLVKNHQAMVENVCQGKAAGSELAEDVIKDEFLDAVVGALATLTETEKKEALILEGIALSGEQFLIDLHQDQWMLHFREMSTEANVAFLNTVDVLDEDYDPEFYAPTEKNSSLIEEKREQSDTFDQVIDIIDELRQRPDYFKLDTQFILKGLMRYYHLEGCPEKIRQIVQTYQSFRADQAPFTEVGKLETLGLTRKEELLQKYQEQWLTHHQKLSTKANIAFLKTLSIFHPKQEKKDVSKDLKLIHELCQRPDYFEFDTQFVLEGLLDHYSSTGQCPPKLSQILGLYGQNSGDGAHPSETFLSQLKRLKIPADQRVVLYQSAYSRVEDTLERAACIMKHVQGDVKEIHADLALALIPLRMEWLEKAKEVPPSQFENMDMPWLRLVVEKIKNEQTFDLCCRYVQALRQKFPKEVSKKPMPTKRKVKALLSLKEIQLLLVKYASAKKLTSSSYDNLLKATPLEMLDKSYFDFALSAECSKTLLYLIQNDLVKFLESRAPEKDKALWRTKLYDAALIIMADTKMSSANSDKEKPNLLKFFKSLQPLLKKHISADQLTEVLCVFSKTHWPFPNAGETKEFLNRHLLLGPSLDKPNDLFETAYNIKNVFLLNEEDAKKFGKYLASLVQRIQNTSKNQTAESVYDRMLSPLYAALNSPNPSINLIFLIKNIVGVAFESSTLEKSFLKRLLTEYIQKIRDSDASVPFITKCEVINDVVDLQEGRYAPKEFIEFAYNLTELSLILDELKRIPDEDFAETKHALDTLYSQIKIFKKPSEEVYAFYEYIFDKMACTEKESDLFTLHLDFFQDLLKVYRRTVKKGKELPAKSQEHIKFYELFLKETERWSQSKPIDESFYYAMMSLYHFMEQNSGVSEENKRQALKRFGEVIEKTAMEEDFYLKRTLMKFFHETSERLTTNKGLGTDDLLETRKKLFQSILSDVKKEVDDVYNKGIKTVSYNDCQYLGKKICLLFKTINKCSDDIAHIIKANPEMRSSLLSLCEFLVKKGIFQSLNSCTKHLVEAFEKTFRKNKLHAAPLYFLTLKLTSLLLHNIIPYKNLPDKERKILLEVPISLAPWLGKLSKGALIYRNKGDYTDQLAMLALHMSNADTEEKCKFIIEPILNTIWKEVFEGAPEALRCCKLFFNFDEELSTAEDCALGIKKALELCVEMKRSSVLSRIADKLIQFQPQFHDNTEKLRECYIDVLKTTETCPIVHDGKFSIYGKIVSGFFDRGLFIKGEDFEKQKIFHDTPDKMLNARTMEIAYLAIDQILKNCEGLKGNSDQKELAKVLIESAWEIVALVVSKKVIDQDEGYSKFCKHIENGFNKLGYDQNFIYSIRYSMCEKLDKKFPKK